MCNLNKREAYYALVFSLLLSVSGFQWLVLEAHKDIVVFLLNSTKKGLLSAGQCVREVMCLRVYTMKDRGKEIANKSN